LASFETLAVVVVVADVVVASAAVAGVGAVVVAEQTAVVVVVVVVGDVGDVGGGVGVGCGSVAAFLPSGHHPSH